MWDEPKGRGAHRPPKARVRTAQKQDMSIGLWVQSPTTSNLKPTFPTVTKQESALL